MGVFTHAIYMAIKCNAHFLHRDGIKCLDNLSYLEKLIQFCSEGAQEIAQPSCLQFQTANSLNMANVRALE